MIRKKTVIHLVLAGVLFACATAIAAGALMSIQVKTGHVRTRPSFLGKVISVLSYGDQVAVLEESGSWKRVSIPGAKGGWMHASALTTKKIVLKPGAEDVEKAATSDELALAGKGFNKEVEDAFKAKNPKVDFSQIDRMERNTVSQAQIAAFVREGELKP